MEKNVLANTLTLDSVRESLIRQEDTVIFYLIERAKYPINSPVYHPSFAGVSGSLVDYIVKHTEALQSKVTIEELFQFTGL